MRSRAALYFLVAVVLISRTPLSANERKIGLDKRVPWTTSKITGSPDKPSPYTLERVFEKQTFDRPTLLTNAPGTSRMFVAELSGKIYSFEPNSKEPANVVIDLQKHIDGQIRVYGLAFHPRFETNRLCYVCYITGNKIEDGTRVSEFKVNGAQVPTIYPKSERLLLSWLSGGHNGGCLKFGPDGFLYITTGDAGPAFPPDPHKSGQDLSTLPSNILRIDVDRCDEGLPYAVPRDNPFVDLEGARGEIWCYGLRNPWKISFDTATGDLWCGDVGWELWEMVYRVQRGGNYGWSLMEGPQPVHRERTRGPTPILLPTIQHSHIESRSVTGGFVSHTKRLPQLKGRYIYGDYVTGKIWAAKSDVSGATSAEEIVNTSLAIICFGQDAAGEVYVVGYNDGGIYRLMPNDAKSANEEFPRRLSETGLFASVKKHEVAPGVIPYSINVPPWEDGMFARRFVALPESSKLGTHKKTNAQQGYIKGDWSFPNDAILMKTLMWNGDTKWPALPVETQILHRDGDQWRAYNYVWNDEGTDAILADEASERTLKLSDPDAEGGSRTYTWHHASRSECMLCHTTRGGTVYGFKLEQLNTLHNYDSKTSSDQLATLQHIGLFEEPLPKKIPKLRHMHDNEASAEEAMRAYLHVNCAHCHRRGGGGTAAIELQHTLTLEKTRMIGARPTQGTFGMLDAQVVAPGDPFRSVLYYRMAKLGRGRMPHFGSRRVDSMGLFYIKRWIESLDSGDEPVKESVVRARRLRDEGLKRAKSGDRAAVATLLSSTSGALALLHSIDRERLPDSLQQHAIDSGAQHSDPQVSDLFERFVPEEKRKKRLGANVDVAKLMSMSGDVQRGRRLFVDGKRVQCKNCHRAENVGSQVGPDFSDIARRLDRAKIVEGILTPSRQIDPKYITYLVETDEGRVLTGLMVETTEKQTILKDAQGKLIKVHRDSIERISPQQKSLMPELLFRDLTAQELIDVVSYLESLKK